jgi:hypothetical protein
VLCFTLLHCFVCIAQSKLTDNASILANIYSGYSLPEYSFISSITNDYINSIELCYIKGTYGKNIWQHSYNYPEQGLSLFYTTLGNDDIFGRELALTYFFKVYFLSINKLRLFNRIGIGLSYVNKKFDYQDNYLNVAVGTKLNIHFNFKLGANYILSDKFNFNTGISFDHFSNANTSEVNLGLNSLTAFAGISYSIGEESEKQIHEPSKHIQRNSLLLFTSIGGKHIRYLNSNYFLTSSLSLEINRAFFQKIRLGIGSDIFYDSSVKSNLSLQGNKYKNSYSFQTGIHITQSIVYNKFSLSIQEGVYILLKEQVNKHKIYSRGIFQYQVNDRFLMRFAMKSHLHILDYPEIGFGYKLGK